jgi:hypothetical protein
MHFGISYVSFYRSANGHERLGVNGLFPRFHSVIVQDLLGAELLALLMASLILETSTFTDHFPSPELRQVE